MIYKTVEMKGIMTKHRTSKKLFLMLIALPMMLAIQSCEETFLDVVPDNVATIDQAFKLRTEAEKYLFTCYSYMPRNGQVEYNIGMLAGDEIWIPYEVAITSYAFEIARGNQRVSNPYMNAWSGNWQGAGPDDNYSLFDGIRHCNIFIKNMEDPTQVPDVSEAERQRWIAEGKFLKAYYHYYLMRMYGPIPIIRENLPINASDEEMNVKREPIDESVDYLAGLFDEAAQNLPPVITDRLTELGRVTAPIAKGMKAKLLLMAASPLFNGNEDMAGFTNKDGTALFNTTYDATKWEKAATAAREAIESAEATGHSLYYFPGSAFNITDTTRTKLSIREAITERWNPEIIWGNSQSTTNDLQLHAMAPLAPENGHRAAEKILSPTLEIASMFYSKNGVPLNEDKSLDFTNPADLREAQADEKYNIEEGYETARLNFDREPRFYADLGFDGAVWYKYDSNSDDTKWHIEGKYADYAGSNHSFFYNVTGYYLKKLVDWNMSFSSSGASYKTYAWPELRLADEYLMYAEALNEAQGPSPEVYDYLNRIRERAGLAGVQESWQNYSVNPDKYTTKDGLREIIHHERNIEMAFEGKRFWDLRRWKEAARELNEPITGWNVYGEDAASYYQVRTLYQQRFIAPRDYFWPIDETSLIQNPNLVQNPGW